jgi:hypothetical protein
MFLSDWIIPVPRGVLKHKYLIHGNILWTKPLISGTVVLGLYYGNEERKQCSKGKVCEGYSAAHIVYSMVYWGKNQGTLVIDSTVQKYTWEGYLLAYGLSEPI